MCSVPEPPPNQGGEIVTDALKSWISRQEHIPKDDRASAEKLITERDAYGFDKYGQHLMTIDGRNTVEDARQELGDLLQYCYKGRMNGEDLSEVRRLLPFLNSLLNG